MRFKNRNQKVLAGHIVKVAYAHQWDNIAIEDIVTGGYDLNKISDEALTRATWQEGMIGLKEMMDHSDFTKEAWIDKLSTLLKKGGLTEEERRFKIAKEATNNVFEYLKSMGWF